MVVAHYRAALCCTTGVCRLLLHTDGKCYAIVEANAGGCCTLMVSDVQCCRGVRAAIPHCWAVLSCTTGECGWLLHTNKQVLCYSAGEYGWLLNAIVQCYAAPRASVGGCSTLLGSVVLQCRRVWVAAPHCEAVIYCSAGECGRLLHTIMECCASL